MKKIVILASLLGSLLILNSCDKIAETTGICAKKWLTVKPTSNKNPRATISGGALILAADSLIAGVNLTVNQASVSGDFEATATFEGFNPGIGLDMTTAFVQFSAIPMASAEVANTGISNITGGTASGIFAGNETSAQPFANKAASISGTMKMTRTGSSLTVVTTVTYQSESDGSMKQVTSTATKADFGTSNVNVGFQFGAANSVVKPVTVKITDFTITGGGALAASDKFDCDSTL